MAEPAPRSGPRYTAGDVPGLRRDLADWYGGTQGAQGTQFYYNAIVMGQQQIKPPGPPERVAPALAAAETARLRDGDLWYVDEDLCVSRPPTRSLVRLLVNGGYEFSQPVPGAEQRQRPRAIEPMPGRKPHDPAGEGSG